MPINIAIPSEILPGEDRVAMVPAVAKTFIAKGCKITLEHNAGSKSYFNDEAFVNADIEKSAKNLYANGDVIIKIICPLYPHLRPAILKALCAKNITCFALERIPRTVSRAQNMDILSSQAAAMGYKAALLAANECKYFFPMLSTAAGTMRPAKVLIIGAGVAGLSAIAAAKRLGARVSAYDVRPQTKEEVKSLGAQFIMLEIQAAGEGGYARELTAEEKTQQQALLEKHIIENDVLITTAGVPGKPAPKIVTQNVIAKMKPGSVIVDIMAEMGGNCDLTKAGEKIDFQGITIIGTKNLASSLCVNTSEMFAKNVFNFLSPFINNGELNIDWNDKVITATLVTHQGSIKDETLKNLNQ
jgi:NAD(P) transhydrogenase subunit alpha